MGALQKGLTLAQMAIAMQWARYKSTRPELDLALMALSSEAGLTSNEMSWLEVRDVVDHRGRINEFVKVRKPPGSGDFRARWIPCVTENLIEALRLHLASSGVKSGPLFTDHSANPKRRSEICRRMKHNYRSCGFARATGESGRYGFRERLLEAATHDSDFSIRDAQLILGYGQLSELVALQRPPARMVQLIDLIWEDASVSANDRPAREEAEATERRPEPVSATPPELARPTSGGASMLAGPAADTRQRVSGAARSPRAACSAPACSGIAGHADGKSQEHHTSSPQERAALRREECLNIWSMFRRAP